MGAELLPRLLDEAVRDVPAPTLAGGAWRRASGIRRRRRAVAVVAVVALTAASAGLLVTTANRPHRPSVVALTPPSAPVGTVRPGVDVLPAALATRTDLPLPAGTPHLRSVAAVPLSALPVRRAVALYQEYGPEGADRPEPVYVWGSDRRWRRLDVVQLAFTRDSGGNRAVPLRSTALAPDGRTAAFAQPDELVVVDLTTATVTRHRLPGFNEDVTWLAPGSVLVRQEGGASTVDLATGAVVRRPAALGTQDVVVDPAGAAPLVVLAGGDAGGDSVALTVRQWRADVAGPSRDIDPAGVGADRLSQWYGRGWRAGDLVVRAAWGQSDGATGRELVAIVDLRTARVVRLLGLGPDRMKECCQPLAWLDPTTVLLRTDKEGIVSWNAATGQVAAVSGRFAGTVSVALP